MKLDDILKDKPINAAPKALDIVSGVRGSGGKGPDDKLATTALTDGASDFFGERDARSVSLDFGVASGRVELTAPIIPAGGLDGLTVDTPSPGGSPDGTPGGVPDVSRQASALLDSFAPDINDLARTGLPLSGFDIPDEQAIREQLRKILRRL